MDLNFTKLNHNTMRCLPFVEDLPLLFKVFIAHALTQTPLIPQVFRQVQEAPHSLPVPYVWGISLTESSNVSPQLSGTGLTKPSPNVFEVNYCYTKTTNPFAPIGNTKEVAPANDTTNEIFALDAVRPATELRHVLELRKLNVLTPYKSDIWEQLLFHAGFLHEYSHVPINLRFGFIVKFPSITFTQTPPNCPSIVELQPRFMEII